MSAEIWVPENLMLIKQREKLGLTQEEVAKKAGIKLEQYQRFESMEHQFSFSSSSLRIVNAVLTTLELDIKAFDDGDYVFETLPEDDPRNKIIEQI